MANLCNTLQTLQQNILSDSDSEGETHRSRRHNGQLPLHDSHHRCRSSSSDGSRKSVDSVYIPRPRYRKQFIERGIIPRPPLSNERRTTMSDSSPNNRPSSAQSTRHKVSVHSERSSDDRDSVDEMFKKLGNAEPQAVVARGKLDVPRCSGPRRKCGPGKRERSSEDSRRDSTDDRKSDTCQERGTSDDSRKSSFDEVFIPKTNGCGPHCLSGPEYIRCRCCGRFKKPETYESNEDQCLNESTQQKQSMQLNRHRNQHSVDSETNTVEDKPPPIPKRKPIKKTKPGTFQPTHIIKNIACGHKPVKHITFREDTKQNTNYITNENKTILDETVPSGAERISKDCMSPVTTLRPSSVMAAPKSRGPLPVLPSYEDIIGARGFGFRCRTSERNQWNQSSKNKNSTSLEHSSLRWRSHSIDTIDRQRYVDVDPTADATQFVSTDNLHISSRKIIMEFLV